MVPAFVTVPVARKATMPPDDPSHAYGTTLAAAAMLAEVYSGTRTS
jgi:hypothetical protein